MGRGLLAAHPRGLPVQMLFPFLAVILGGLGIAIETPTNALLMKTTTSMLWASFISFLVGAAVLGLALMVTRAKLPAGWVGQTPWYGFIGGLYGAGVVTASSWATPKLGAGTTLVVIVAAQVALAVVLDQLGALGLEHHPLGWLRIAGVLVVSAGAVMVSLG